jgi:hypothetical protein
MASICVTEYNQLWIDPNSGSAMVKEPPLFDQLPVIVSAVANSSAPFGLITKAIRVQTNADISFAIGTGVVATINNRRMAAKQTEYFAVSPGDVISVIANSGA